MRMLQNNMRDAKNSNRARGFTLIELLVIVAITALISGFAVNYSKISQRQVTLHAETQKAAGFLFKAKSLAVSTYVSPNQVRCGYGVFFDYSSRGYKLFTYDVPQGEQATCASLASIPESAITELSGSVLNNGIVFEDRGPDSLDVVFFVPPTPKTLISTNGGASFSKTPGKLYLATEDGLAESVITVNLAGQIDF